MRSLFWLLLAAVLLAGCSGNDDPADAADETGDDPPARMPPDALHFDGTLLGVGQQGVTTAEGCVLPLSCADHAFSLDEPWRVTATLIAGDDPLDGTPMGPDHDLWLFDAAGAEKGSSTNPTGEADIISVKLDAGTYTLHVQGYRTLASGYSLDVTFEPL